MPRGLCRQMVERDLEEETELLVNSSNTVEDHVNTLLLDFITDNFLTNIRI